MLEEMTDSRFYHYDSPLTIDHELNVLRAAGFTQCEILKNLGASYTVKAAK